MSWQSKVCTGMWMSFRDFTDLLRTRMYENCKNSFLNSKTNWNYRNALLNRKPTMVLSFSRNQNFLMSKDLIKSFLDNKRREIDNSKNKKKWKHQLDKTMKKIKINISNLLACLLDRKFPEILIIQILLI